MTSIFTLNQRINQLMSTMDKLQTKITSTATTTLILTDNNININFKNLSFMTLSLNMTNNISSFTLLNPVINGNYKIFMHSTSPFVLSKSLGANIKNNLKGSTMILGYWIINIHYNGTFYFFDFQNFT
jgi:hypothetical protein